MAIATLRNRSKPARNPRKRNTPTVGRLPEPLTIGAAYDLALHGAGLTASALYVEKNNAQDVRRLIQPWQARAMSYYDLVPEVKFAATFYSQMLRKVRLFPALLDPDTHEPEEIHVGPVFDAFQRIKDRSGGREELQGSYGKLKFLIGEGYLTVSPDVQRGEIWEFLSPNELRVQPGGIASRFRAPMLSADNYIIGNDQARLDEYGEPLGPAFAERGPDVIVVYRLWRSHPAYTELADCNMQASIDLLEELVLSTYSVRAQLKSRLNNGGILWVPDEISFTSLGNNPEEDPDSDQFQERLTQTIMAAISDPGTAAAFSPIVARVAADFIGKIQHTKFNDTPGELAEISQRTEMIGRWATGIELPKEVVTGMGDIQHWGQWLISEETWDSYGLPASQEMASDINAAYLQPTVREEGFPDWESVCIGVDPSAVIFHPDRAKNADALFAGRAISKKIWRESKGYNDNDAMPDDERAESIGVATRDSSLAWDGVPSVRGGSLEPSPGVIESAAGSSSEPVAPSSTGADLERGAPVGGSGGSDSGPALVSSAAGRESEILGAAAFAVQRGRELAGSRLRAMTSGRGPRAARCAECQAAIDGVANWDVAAVLGREQVELVGGSASSLVEGAGALFASVVSGWVGEGWALELAGLVEDHAARSLFDRSAGSLPDGFGLLLGRVHLPLEKA